MVLFCWCGQLPEKNRERKTKREMDFRKADPNYVNFVPKTCGEAIDLFNRHKKLGLATHLYPECFVHCARKLPDEELDNFHRYIIAPGGDIEKGGEKPTLIDEALEKERLALLKEAELRDMPAVQEQPEDLHDVSLTEEFVEEDEKRDFSEPEESLCIIESAQ